MGCLKLAYSENETTLKVVHSLFFSIENPAQGIFQLKEKSDADAYRFGGSNGQEKDFEIAPGMYTAEYWEYDSRLGRRWNVDPVWYPHQSGYATFNNNPIYFADPSGLDGEGPNGECPGDVRKKADGTIQKYTLNGWEKADYPKNMNSSEAVFDEIKAHEGLGPNVVKDANGKIVKIYAYDCTSGVGTIGYGITMRQEGEHKCFDPYSDPADVPYQDGITLEQAEQLLVDKVSSTYEKNIERLIKVPLTQNEFDALVIATFNGAMRGDVISVVNSKNYDVQAVYAAFEQTRTDQNGKELSGLICRRAEEAHYYLFGKFPNLKTSQVTIKVCDNNDVEKEAVLTIDHKKIWINCWNNFADKYQPLGKSKLQFKSYIDATKIKIKKEKNSTKSNTKKNKS